MTTDRGLGALATIQNAMDNLNNAIDDTHPEGCGCDICHAADAMDAILAGLPADAVPDAERLRARIDEAVRGLPRYAGTVRHEFGSAVSLADVLAILERLP